MPLQQCRLRGRGNAVQFIAVFFCAMDVLNAGLEYGWTSAAFPVLLNPKDNQSEALITSQQGVWIATLSLPGAALGALANVFICDLVGRKPFIIFSTIPYAIHWILIAISQTAYVYYIARLISGFSSGMSLTAVPMYTAEISIPRLRGRLCAFTPMCICAGVFLMNFLCLFLTLEVAALLALVFPLTSFIGLIFMPESPYYYLMKNKDEKALQSLQIFQGKEDVDTDFQRMKQAVQKLNETKEKGFKALVTVKVNRRSLLVVGVLRAAQPLCGITTLVYYSSVILGDNEWIISVRYCTLLFAIALMISDVVGLNIVDLLGRRPLILTSIGGACCGLLTLAIYLHLKDSDVDLSSCSFIPLVALVTIVSFYGFGLQQIPFVVQGELFSTAVKSCAIGLGMMLFCLFSFVGSKYFQFMNDKNKPYVTIYTFAFCAASLFTFILFFMPETKDISLEDVQLMMEQRKLHFKDVDTKNN
ncbi:facilitated trehalose transporter Tret1-like [Harmonia axyridis]|uniref:facilitated trehalose transporter Tret1-like n=1 Tax=Harmonia axyridis TaxID=115357 RepID=UPI001E274EE6|nr:facilitated trehalose transporter Tret1-like [Harmonia axyridis]